MEGLTSHGKERQCVQAVLGPRSGEVGEETEPRGGSARWEPWKDKGLGSLGISKEAAGS